MAKYGYIAAQTSVAHRNGTRMLRLQSMKPDLTKIPIIGLHGWSADQNWQAVLNTSATTLFGDPIPTSGSDALIAAGYTVYRPFTGSNWGTNTIYPAGTGGTGQQAITDAIAQAAADGFDTSVVHITGTSGGAINGLNYAWRNPTKVARLWFEAPGFDLAYLYDQDATTNSWGLGSVSVSLRSVHGGTDKNTWLPLSEPYDPYRNTASISTALSGKIAICAGTNDEVVHHPTLVTWCDDLGIPLTSYTASHLTLSTQADEFLGLQWLEAYSQ